MDFNPRIHEDATGLQLTSPVVKMISIHASMRMRPDRGVVNSTPYGISIHASMRMRRGDTAATKNPTYISIHASMRMRPDISVLKLVSSNFNPRIHEDATAIYGNHRRNTY